jgi:hypothetical protein
MSLSAREEQALECIADRLTGSDPGLAAMLGTFTRLTSGEEMPAREAVAEAQGGSHGHHLRHRGKRRPAGGPAARNHPSIPWLPTVVLLIVGAVIVAVAGLTGGGSGGACARSLGLTCVSPVRARPPGQQVTRIGGG